MTSPLAGYLRRLDDPELAALRPGLVERLLLGLLRELGMPATIRDASGRGRALLGGSELGNDPEGDVPEELRDSPLRYFDASGAELPTLRHPAHIARTTGSPQRNVVLGVRLRSGQQRWFKSSYIPLTREEQGWSVFSVGVEISDLLEARREADQRVKALEALLVLSASLVDARPSGPSELARAARPFAERYLPQCQISVSVIEGRELRIYPVQLQPGMDPPRERVAVSAPLHQLWNEDLHVNLSVKDTDIYGTLVVGMLDRPFRSIVVAPLLVRGERAGSFACMSPVRNAFSPAQIEALQEAGRLLAHALRGGEQSAAA